MRKLVLLQARSSSSRLPQKSLLKIKNLPLIGFIYKRIKSKKYKVVVLTSKDKSDDYFSSVLEYLKINFFRGSLKNVKKRFLSYTKEYDDNDIIVRLTGDNILVNRKIIDISIDQLIKRNKNYLYTNPKLSGLPNGISVEVFRLNHLRSNKSNSASDREHVTYSFEKKLENTVKVKKVKKFWKNTDCTIDYLDHYLKLKKILDNQKIKINDDWEIIVDRISKNKKIKFNIRKKIKLVTYYNYQLSNSLKLKICKLKDQTWRYGIQSQLKYFNDNSSKSDLHNLMFYENKLIGYTTLKKKSFLYQDKKNKFNKLYYLLFDSFVIKKKYRKMNFAHILISYDNNKIFNKNIPALLLCENKIINFYYNHFWKKLPKKMYSLMNKKTDLNLMSLNLNKNFYKKKISSKMLIRV